MLKSTCDQHVPTASAEHGTLVQPASSTARVEEAPRPFKSHLGHVSTAPVLKLQCTGFSKLATQLQQKRVAPSRDLLPGILENIQSAANMQFDMYCSQSMPSRAQLAGHCVCLHPDHGMLIPWLQRYLVCKALQPAATSACILVPADSLHSCSELLKGMRLLKRYAKGTHLYKPPPGWRAKSPYPAIKDPIFVFMDKEVAPACQDVTHRVHPAVMTEQATSCAMTGSAVAAKGDQGTLRATKASFCATVGTTQDVPVLLDSGAVGASFIDGGLCKALGLHSTACDLEILLGDGSAIRSVQQVHVPVHMSGMTMHASPYVVPHLCAPFQLVLGTDFLEHHRARLDFGQGKVTLYSGLNTLCLAFDRSALPAERTPALDQHMFADLPAQHARLIEEQPVFAPRHVRKRDRRLQGYYCSVLVRVGNAVPDVPTATDLQSDIASLTNEYADLFQEPTGLPPVRNIEHVIDLQPGTAPAYTKPYRLSAPELAELELQITDLLRKGLIEPSNSPYGAPVFFVSKADGSLRPVFDYRKLNANLVPQRFPLPRIDELLDRLHGAKFFTSLDLTSGFHQVRLRPADKPKTAFTTPVGHYQWCVSPFGLQSSPSTFQRLMSSIFAPAAYTADGMPHVHSAFRSFVLVYIDDILIYSKTASEHLAHLRAVFDTLRQHTIFLKQKKCKFGLSELKFLGHIVSSEGVSPDPDKVRAVADWPALQNIYDVQCFMGLCNYFRKFIPGYAHMVRPITMLTRKSHLFVWGEEQQGAFEAVKKALSSAPVLAVPDLNDEFELVTDASDYGLGALLLQKGRPIAYESRGLNAAELNYGMPDKELLAVIWALTKWRCYLQARRFKVITDHQPNVAFPRCNLTAHRRRARWADFLSQFNIDWVYTPGKNNVADPLSRVPGLQRKEHAQFNLQFHHMCAALTRRMRALEESQAHAVAQQSATDNHAASQQSDMPEHAVAPEPQGHGDSAHEQHPDATTHTAVYTVEGSGEQGIVEPLSTKPATGHHAEGQQPDVRPVQPVPIPSAPAPLGIDSEPAYVAPAIDHAPHMPLPIKRQAVPGLHVNWTPSECNNKRIGPVYMPTHTRKVLPISAVNIHPVSVDTETDSTMRPELQEPESLLDWIRQATAAVPPAELPSCLLLRDGFAWQGEQIWVPDATGLRKRLIHEHHDMPYRGHFGNKKTLEALQLTFTWATAAHDVREYISGCQRCIRVKPWPRAIPPLQPLQVPDGFWESVSCDFVLGLPLTPRGHDAICVFVDRLSKYTHIVPCTKNCSSEQWADMFVKHIFANHGMPREIVSDRGSQFKSEWTAALQAELGVKRCMSTAYHPQTDGQTERCNRVIEDILRAYVTADMTEWDTQLPLCQYAINTAWHFTVEASPFFLNHGRHPNSPMLVDLPRSQAVSAAGVIEGCTGDTLRGAQAAIDMQTRLARAKKCMYAAQQRHKHFYDKNKRPRSFKVGDMVLLSSKNLSLAMACSKLEPRYIGPLKVTERIGSLAYRLELPQHYLIHNVFHVSLLRPWFNNGMLPPPPLPVLIDDEEEFVIDHIVSHRRDNRGKGRGLGALKYLIRWKGHDPGSDKWVPASALDDCEALDLYWKDKPVEEWPAGFQLQP